MSTDLETNLQIIEEFTQRLQVAVIGAEETTDKHVEWVEGPVDGTIPTANGPLKTLRGQIAEWRLAADQDVASAITGYDAQFAAALAQFQVEFDSYLITVGFEPAVEYVAGILIERRAQTVIFDGVTYYWVGSLPYTTTGDFGEELSWQIAPIVGGIEIPGFNFAAGGKLLRKNQSVLGLDGEWYYWTGTFPKTIPPASTLESAGGVGENLFKIASGFPPLRPILKLVVTSMGMNLNTGSFESGATIVDNEDILVQFLTGRVYRWNGPLPKVVDLFSTPGSSGGTGPGAWEEIQTSYSRTIMLESLRRSYAEAGYNLVAGSFEAGGVLTSATDVLVYETSGKVYSGGGPFPRTVAAGTDPASGGFILRSDEVATNYTGIRAYRGSAKSVRIYGRSNIFDGGHGFAYLDPLDTTSADNDATIWVDALDRRWKRDDYKNIAIRAEWCGVGSGNVLTDSAGLRNAIVVANGRPIILSRDAILSDVDVTTATSKFILVADQQYMAFHGKIKIKTPSGSPCIFKGTAHTLTLSGFDFESLGTKSDGVGTTIFRNLANNGVWVNISNFSTRNFSGPTFTVNDLIQSNISKGYVTDCDIGFKVGLDAWPTNTTTTFDDVYIERCRLGVDFKSLGRSSMKNCIIEHCDYIGSFVDCHLLSRESCYFEANLNKTVAVDCLFVIVNEFAYAANDIIDESYVNLNQYERGASRVDPTVIVAEKIKAKYNQLQRIMTSAGGVWSIGKFYREANVHRLIIDVTGGSATNNAEIFGECRLSLNSYGNAFSEINCKKDATANSAVGRAYAVQVDFNTVEIILDLRQFAALPMIEVKVDDGSIFLRDIKRLSSAPSIFIEFL